MTGMTGMTSGRSPVRALADSGFVTLPPSASVAEAGQALADAAFAVVVDPGGGPPVALLTPEDLVGATRTALADADPPTAVCLADDLLLDELTAPEVLAVLDALDVRGVVLVNADGEPVAVLPMTVVDTYLGSGEHRPADDVRGPYGDAGDARLGGRPRIRAVRVVCAKPACRYSNELLDYAWNGESPVCQNPDIPSHQLVLPRR